MAKGFPQRTADHNREERSRRYFERQLPGDWASHRPGNDYGIDIHVDIFENGNATGLELIVQLKATDEADDGDTERVRIPVRSYNYLMHRTEVAMLVRYIDDDEEAYWILLRDIPPPTDGQRTFTVRIPKTNRLSAIQWDRIVNLVRRVTDRKLAAGRAEQLRPRN